MCQRIDQGGGHDTASTTHARRAVTARHGRSHPGGLHRGRGAAGAPLRTPPRQALRTRGAALPAAPGARQLARSSVNQYGCACRFFYGTVLELEGQAFQIPLAPAPQRLPELLSREKLVRLFAVATPLKSRTFLKLAYGTGLRLSQLCHLRVAHIDSHADRMCIRIEQGKDATCRCPRTCCCDPPSCALLALPGLDRPVAHHHDDRPLHRAQGPQAASRTRQASQHAQCAAPTLRPTACPPQFDPPPPGRPAPVLAAWPPCTAPLPKHPAETYTAHATPSPAVQSNEVYLTPCTAVPSFQRRPGVR